MKALTGGEWATQLGLSEGWTILHYKRTYAEGKDFHAYFGVKGKRAAWYHAETIEDLQKLIAPYTEQTQLDLTTKG